MQVLVCKNNKVHFDMKCDCHKKKKTVKHLRFVANFNVPPGEYKVSVSSIENGKINLDLVNFKNQEQRLLEE